MLAERHFASFYPPAYSSSRITRRNGISARAAIFFRTCNKNNCSTILGQWLFRFARYDSKLLTVHAEAIFVSIPAGIPLRETTFPFPPPEKISEPRANEIPTGYVIPSSVTTEIPRNCCRIEPERERENRARDRAGTSGKKTCEVSAAAPRSQRSADPIGKLSVTSRVQSLESDGSSSNGRIFAVELTVRVISDHDDLDLALVYFFP